ncbi:MAG: hypothetical protein KC524_13220, partial [Gammaproteobacteria bacterium]|nr:hypothetical protein [Gammaproteobacteria bacterium]
MDQFQAKSLAQLALINKEDADRLRSRRLGGSALDGFLWGPRLSRFTCRVVSPGRRSCVVFLP